VEGNRPRSLRFRSDGTFTIVQFTDLHLHDNREANERTLALMAQVLESEQPDFAVLTGDIIAGRSCSDPAATFLEAVRPLEERAVPWAAVFGNHDDEGTASREELLAAQRLCRYGLTQRGPAQIAGVGNFTLDVHSSKGSDDAAAVLYFLDSGSYAPEGVGGYAWIQPSQVEWFRRTAGAKGARPGLVFFHIPLPEYETLWQTGDCLGSKHEPVCCPRVNSGLFLAMLEAGTIRGVFVGHDHVNDFEGDHFGIRLCYGRAGGYGTYGREGFPRGARVIRLHERAGDFETWLRLDDGSRVERRTLSPPACA